MAKKKRFAPMGKGYDKETAKKEGMKPDKSGHMGTRAPKSGKILKGRRHPTWDKGRIRDELLDYGVEYRDGGYYSTPRKKKK